MDKIKVADLLRAADGITSARRRDSFSAATVCPSGPQHGFATSRAKRIATHAGRRSGKTVAEAAVALDDSIEPPFVPQLYITLTRANAKEIFWPELLDLNERFNLGCEVNIADLTIRRPGGSPIQLRGADKQTELAKVRGKKFKKVFLDEASYFRSLILENLIKRDLRPTLADYNGSLCVSGTPTPTNVGFFYDVCVGKLKDRYEVHHWTLRENAHLPAYQLGQTADDILREVREEFGWGENDPTYMREWLGLFVEDPEALLFQYSEAINGVDDIDLGGEWITTMGVDLGAVDSTAIAVWGWRRHENGLWLLHEEESTPGSGTVDVQDVAEMAAPLIEKWKPRSVDVDQGGLGLMVANTLRKRYGLPVTGAEKARKGEHIKLMNADLRKGLIKVRRHGIWARDARLVERDPKALREDKLEEKKGGYHSNIADAALYGWRGAQHFLEVPAAERKSEEDVMAERRFRQVEKQARMGDGWEAIGAALGYGDDE